MLQSTLGGKLGPIPPFAGPGLGVLVISQTGEVHNETEVLLIRLREVARGRETLYKRR